MRLGADPEVFLRKDEILVSAIGLIEGTKEEPKLLEKGFYIQQDNILAEFNIPPSNSKKEFVRNISKGKKLVNNYLSKKGLSMDISVSYDVDPSLLKSQESREFGCEPDINAYDFTERCINIEDNIRTAGGHVHVEYDLNDGKIFETIKLLDLYLGLPSIFLDNNDARRKLYGRAGHFRMKDYGFEYRTLSNFWIKDSKLVEWVWDSVARAASAYIKGQRIDISSEGQLIQDCINDSDRKLAKYYMEKYKIKLPEHAKVTV